MQRYLDGKVKSKNLREIVEDIDSGKWQEIVDKVTVSEVKKRETKYERKLA